MVGNIVQGNRLASAQGRDLGIVEEESDSARKVFHSLLLIYLGSCHKRQKPQAPTPQAPIRKRQTIKVANAKGLNRNTNLT